jgi:hypothetical protein
VLRGPALMMYPYGLWHLGPQGQTDLAREVTVELLPMGQVLLDLEVLITFGSVVDWVPAVAVVLHLGSKG